jgi:hypothetical protein
MNPLLQYYSITLSGCILYGLAGKCNEGEKMRIRDSREPVGGVNRYEERMYGSPWSMAVENQ